MKAGAARYVVRGRVQGVGFRWFVQHAARQLGLHGFVRNLAGGEVEVVASGPATALEALERSLHQGPPAALVRGVEKTDVPHEVRLPSNFEIN